VREQARLRAHAEQVAEGYLELLRWLHPRLGSRLPFGWGVRDAGEAEAAASRLRMHLELGSGAIERLAEVVEDAGALVVEGADHDRFDALSGRTRAGLPVIVFNPSRSSDRIRFNVAHELAHLVLDCKSVAPAEEEQIAHRFAAAFLVPAGAARRELGERRSRIARAELEMLKRKYGLSMQAWTRRARDLGIISEAHYREWQVSFRASATHVRETAEYGIEDRPRRLALLCIQAVAEGMIDRRWIRERLPGVRPEDLGLPRERSKEEDAGALPEFLRLPPSERRDVLEAQAKVAAADYASSPEAREWIEFDDPAPDGAEDRG
jgi:Zn-dependent peptidase ImmA (M78 family)